MTEVIERLLAVVAYLIVSAILCLAFVYGYALISMLRGLTRKLKSPKRMNDCTISTRQ